MDRFPAGCDELWARAASEFDVIVVRDAAHLAWRYADPRGGLSTLLVAEERGRMVGWAILKKHGTRGYLADLLVDPGRQDVVEQLARAAVDPLDAAGAHEIGCWLPVRHPYRHGLRCAGFLGWGRSVKMAYRWEGDGVVDDGLLGRTDTRLHFTLGDSDFV